MGGQRKVLIRSHSSSSNYGCQEYPLDDSRVETLNSRSVFLLQSSGRGAPEALTWGSRAGSLSVTFSHLCRAEQTWLNQILLPTATRFSLPLPEMSLALARSGDFIPNFAESKHGSGESQREQSPGPSSSSSSGHPVLGRAQNGSQGFWPATSAGTAVPSRYGHCCPFCSMGTDPDLCNTAPWEATTVPASCPSRLSVPELTGDAMGECRRSHLLPSTLHGVPGHPSSAKGHPGPRDTVGAGPAGGAQGRSAAHPCWPPRHTAPLVPPAEHCLAWALYLLSFSMHTSGALYRYKIIKMTVPR